MLTLASHFGMPTKHLLRITCTCCTHELCRYLHVRATRHRDTRHDRAVHTRALQVYLAYLALYDVCRYIYIQQPKYRYTQLSTELMFKLSKTAMIVFSTNECLSFLPMTSAAGRGEAYSPQCSLYRSVLCHMHPSNSRDLHLIVGPPRGGQPRLRLLTCGLDSRSGAQESQIS